MQTTTTKKKI